MYQPRPFTARTQEARRVNSLSYQVLCRVLCIAIVGGALAGCGQKAPSAVATPAATMPPGVTPRTVGLAKQPWSLSDDMHRVQPSAGAAPVFRYTGTGQKVLNEYATLKVPVTPGTIYVFSARVDLANLIGQADVVIDTADSKRTYVSTYADKSAGPRVVSTPPWKAPPGVTEARVGVQLAQSAVENGRTLTFSEPTLLSATPPGNP